MKKHITLFFLIHWGILIQAQSDSIKFDSKCNLRDGIYTSCLEVLNNVPKYPGCKLEVRVEPIFGKTSLFYLDMMSHKQEFKDSLFSIVQEGKMALRYKNGLYRLLSKGAISTFYATDYYRYSGRSQTNNKLYYLDLKTGNMEKLNHENIDNILQRDREIYEEFSSMPVGKKERSLYSYVLKYNSRNPVYIRTR